MASIIGAWSVVQKSIVGTSESTFTFTEAGGTIRLDITGSRMAITPVEVVQTGDVVVITLDMSKPLPTRVMMTLQLVGDRFTGNTQARFLPSGTLEGTRRQFAPVADVPVA
ncbi:MAG: hypothetical protein J7480_07740 [Microbacteriaceae bacterium]|nr:hypothetical protein [Microbacteriaceae bacterium]